MVATPCQTKGQIFDWNNYQLLQTSGCHCCCPCHCAPPISDFTYCVLKNICKKILRELCQEQKKEVYTVFDGGRCSKYEALIKDARIPSKNENQFACFKARLPCNKAKRPSIKERVVCQDRKKRSLDQSDQKTTTRKEANARAKQCKKIEKESEMDVGKVHAKQCKKIDKESQTGLEEEKNRDEDIEIDQKGRCAREAKSSKENEDTAQRDKLEREKADRDKAKALKEREKAQAEFVVSPCYKRNLVNKRGLQGNCGKQRRGLLVNRLDIDRDFAKRQVERFERTVVSPSPYSKPCERPCVLSQVDSIRPCDYMRANMEFKEIYRPRVLPPREPCVSGGTWIAFSNGWSYGSRPVTSSYSVSYPVSRTYSGSSRVYTSSYPIYSYSPRITQRRVISSPIRTIYSTPIVRTRIVTSPIRTTRVYSSPVRTTTTRVYSSPVRTTTTRVYTSPIRSLGYSSLYTAPITTRVYESPVRVYSTSSIYRSSLTPERIITSPIRTLPSVLNREYSRISKRVRPGFGDHQLSSYLNSEPFINFEEETKRIRNSTNTLMRDLHTPVRNARSMTPFPAYSYEPTSKQTLDSYIARVTNPTRHLAKEVRNLVDYPETPRKYVGKSHLASINIVGDKAYTTRNPLYSSDKVRTDINLLAYYIQRKRDGKLGNSNKVVVSNGVPDLDPFRPSRKFSAPLPLENSVDVETKEKQRLRQERMMTVTEETVIDEIAVEKKRAARNDAMKRMDAISQSEKKSRVERSVNDDVAAEKKKAQAEAEAKTKAEAEAKAKAEAEAMAKAEAEAKAKAEAEAKAKAAAEAQAKAAAEAEALAKAAAEAEAQAKAAAEAEALAKAAAEAEAQAKAAAEAEALAKAQAEAEQLEAARKAEEEERNAREARIAEQARLAEEAKKANEARIAEEQKAREEELNRLAELEKIAGEEREAELARQAAELAEIARQDAEIAAQELQAIQQTSTAETLAEVDSKPVIEEPQTPVDEISAPIADQSVNIDEVKSDVEE